MSITIGESTMTRLTGFFDTHKVVEVYNGYQHVALIRYTVGSTIYIINLVLFLPSAGCLPSTPQ